jgi:hypothetical protein
MTTYTEIDDVRGEEHIDSRDLIELRDNLREWLAEDEDNAADDIEAAHAAIAAIDELESAGIEDFPYGAHMIREDCFEDHARELAEGIGAIDRDANWPLSYIDWPAAADALKADYISVSFLGHDYYVR